MGKLGKSEKHFPRKSLQPKETKLQTVHTKKSSFLRSLRSFWLSHFYSGIHPATILWHPALQVTKWWSFHLWKRGDCWCCWVFDLWGWPIWLKFHDCMAWISWWSFCFLSLEFIIEDLWWIFPSQSWVWDNFSRYSKRRPFTTYIYSETKCQLHQLCPSECYARDRGICIHFPSTSTKNAVLRELWRLNFRSPFITPHRENELHHHRLSWLELSSLACFRIARWQELQVRNK